MDAPDHSARPRATETETRAKTVAVFTADSPSPDLPYQLHRRLFVLTSEERLCSTQTFSAFNVPISQKQCFSLFAGVPLVLAC